MGGDSEIDEERGREGNTCRGGRGGSCHDDDLSRISRAVAAASSRTTTAAPGKPPFRETPPAAPSPSGATYRARGSTGGAHSVLIKTNRPRTPFFDAAGREAPRRSLPPPKPRYRRIARGASRNVAQRFRGEEERERVGRTSHLDFFLRGACGNASVNVHHHHQPSPHDDGGGGGDDRLLRRGGRYGKRRSTLASASAARRKKRSVYLRRRPGSIRRSEALWLRNDVINTAHKKTARRSRQSVYRRRTTCAPRNRA